MCDVLPEVFEFQLQDQLPIDWQEQVLTVSAEYARVAELRGGASTSREPAGTTITYRLLDGDGVARKLPWLDQLYRTELVKLATKVVGRAMVVSASVINGVNLNVLEGAGSRYEWHVDSNPLTGLLFCTTHAGGEGGELVFSAQDEKLTIQSKAGTFLLFDARRSPHCVRPLHRSGLRISAPMNFFYADEEQLRPSDLDATLYS
jgi:2OG-Fe(II) oxygenase superfamily